MQVCLPTDSSTNVAAAGAKQHSRWAATIQQDPATWNPERSTRGTSWAESWSRAAACRPSPPSYAPAAPAPPGQTPAPTALSLNARSQQHWYPQPQRMQQAGVAKTHAGSTDAQPSLLVHDQPAQGRTAPARRRPRRHSSRGAHVCPPRGCRPPTSAFACSAARRGSATSAPALRRAC